MFPHLDAKVQARAAARVAQLIDQRTRAPLPKGVSAQAVGQGVIFTGRRLLARFITDPLIRSYLI